MSFRDWLHNAALRGCLIAAIAAPVALHAQQNPPQQPVAQQPVQTQPAANPPLAVTITGPVEVRPEKQDEPNWGNPQCASPHNHDEADLCEQRRMAEAAKQTVILNCIQIGLGVFGFFALIFTIVLSIRSNRVAIAATKAAIESNAIARTAAEIQTRAYLAIEGGEYEIGPHSIQGHILVKNFGASPADDVEIKLSLSVRQNWAGGKLMPAYPPTEMVNPYISRLPKMQPSSEGKLWFYWHFDSLGEENAARIRTHDKFHFVIDCILTWHSVFESPTSSSLRAQVSNARDFVQPIGQGTALAGELHVRNDNRP